MTLSPLPARLQARLLINKSPFVSHCPSFQISLLQGRIWPNPIFLKKWKHWVQRSIEIFLTSWICFIAFSFTLLLNPWASLFCKDNFWPGLRPDASPHQASSPVAAPWTFRAKAADARQFYFPPGCKDREQLSDLSTSVSLWTRLPFHLSRQQTGCGPLCQLPDGLVPPGGSGQSVLVLDSGLPKEKKKLEHLWQEACLSSVSGE